MNVFNFGGNNTKKVIQFKSKVHHFHSCFEIACFSCQPLSKIGVHDFWLSTYKYLNHAHLQPLLNESIPVLRLTVWFAVFGAALKPV
ncbi:hypothetical protein RRG08_025992 [Elysia crispata]|uniref:Uncharacterized protein n=1 Tax=Elysia crispata TaxID=231223 RepID=A0AAE1B7U5_9GAST|nr:hypothetical protein RRG08_025992 [Elysia crispata]